MVELDDIDFVYNVGDYGEDVAFVPALHVIGGAKGYADPRGGAVRPLVILGAQAAYVEGDFEFFAQNTITQWEAMIDMPAWIFASELIYTSVGIVAVIPYTISLDAIPPTGDTFRIFSFTTNGSAANTTTHLMNPTPKLLPAHTRLVLTLTIPAAGAGSGINLYAVHDRIVTNTRLHLHAAKSHAQIVDTERIT